MQSYFVIITGTDPNSSKGGIGVILPGYFRAFKSIGIDFVSIPTYNPDIFGGKHLLWIWNLPRIIKEIIKRKKMYEKVIIYSHAGSGISLLREYLVQSLAKYFGAKIVLHNHAPQIDNYLNSRWKSLLYSFVAQIPDVLVVLTQWWKNRLESAGIKAEIKVVHNPLKEDLEIKAKASKINEEKHDKKIRILTMARLVRGKGVDVAVKAMGYMPDIVTMTVAGDGPEKAHIEELISKYNLNDRVKMVGWVSGAAKINLLDNSDIFCLPTKNDAFPIAFVEAMAYGLPVVGVEYGGIPDIVPNGKVGFLVQKQDPEMIAVELKKLLNHEIRCKMGTEAKKWVLFVCSAEKVGKSLEKIFHEIH